jgi:hypothetical protein
MTLFPASSPACATSMVLLTVLSLGTLTAADQRAADGQPASEVNIIKPSAIVEETVVTPMGRMPRSHAHSLARGQGLNIQGDHIDVLDQVGAVTARHALTSDVVAGLQDGWITDTAWYNRSILPIASFQSTWTVPPPPYAWDGQVIFLFNGMENADHILQPVLQYGESAAGGGPYWAIASWYVSSSNQAFFTALTPVAPGTSVTGIMARSGGYGVPNNYVCYFAGVGASVMPIYNIPELKYCFETLECYNMVGGQVDYPATNGIVFSNINIQLTAGHPSLQWTPQNLVTNFGQHAYVISNSSEAGAIALFYYY